MRSYESSIMSEAEKHQSENLSSHSDVGYTSNVPVDPDAGLSEEEKAEIVCCLAQIS